MARLPVPGGDPHLWDSLLNEYLEVGHNTDGTHKALLVVAKAGTPIATRNRINLIEGSNVTLTVADDNTNGEVDITIAAAGGGSGGVGPAYLHVASSDLMTGGAFPDPTRYDRADIKCDGVNDQDDINTALAASRYVAFSPGRYFLRSPAFAQEHGQTIQGSGWGQDTGPSRDMRGTVFMPDATNSFNSTQDDEALLIVANTTRDENGYFTPRVGTTIQNIGFHGNGLTSGDTGGVLHGLLFCAQMGQAQNIYVAGNSGDGLRLEGKGDDPLVGGNQADQLYETKMFNIEARSNGGWGINGNNHAGDAHIMHFNAKQNAFGGIRPNSAWQLAEFQVYNNQGPGISVETRGVRITNGKIETNRKGIYMNDAAHTTIISGTGFQNNCDDPNADNWIDIDVGVASDAIIGTCMFDSVPASGSNYSRYNIRVQGGADRVSIVGNQFDGGTRDVQDTNADSIKDASNTSVRNPAIFVAGAATNVYIEANGGYRTTNESSATIGSGDTIAHGLGTVYSTGVVGVTPDFVSVLVESDTVPIFATVSNRGATTFLVRLWNHDGTAYAGNDVLVHWRAAKVNW